MKLKKWQLIFWNLMITYRHVRLVNLESKIESHFPIQHGEPLIFFLKFKSEVVGVFWKFKKTVENQSDNHIQILRSDKKLAHQLITPYTSQQNRVSERQNKYILDMTRCMLHEQNLPKKLWAETAHTAIFLQNRLPTKAVKDQTPYKAWYGHKPSLNFLKIFCCLCFTHVPQIKRDKLDKKTLPGVFISYSTVVKAYKIFRS
ncbi:Retrovirus-related Pol polyprotein from transposon TNT 1-94 [Gossypium australe]|uniref:Retrovirus-related Pol polyprotein from transposon TNT 1-94 n=1 Tax=Gossypium australe TaxID=47621 RepID=A0A5B6W6D4_9ROSI|nr:Retrovirus-related Pol polyprotein from transposon TNT 1-94 [Gossypium australe]